MYIRLLKTNFPRLLLVAYAVLGAGCASMNAAECSYADWHTIGIEDGAAGRPVGHISAHRKACAEHGVKPDMLSYREGRQEGLRSYCTLYNGVQAGKAGQQYHGVCDPLSEGDFLEGHKLGGKIQEISGKLDATNAKIATVSEELSSEETPADARHGLVQQLRQLERKSGRLQVRLRTLQSREERMLSNSMHAEADPLDSL